MICKNCGSKEVVEGVVFGRRDNFQNIGPKYKEGFLVTYVEETLCDICEDCGEIQRLYVLPGSKRNWVHSTVDRQEVLNQMARKNISKKEEEFILKEIAKYSDLLITNQCTKSYVNDLENYAKHKWYDYPVKTEGPSYRLYTDKLTGETVMIKPSTMNLHKGKYVVCTSPLQEISEDDIFIDNY